MQKVSKESFFKAVNDSTSDPMPMKSEIAFIKENRVVVKCEAIWRDKNVRQLFGKTVSHLGGGKHEEKHEYFLAI